MKMLSVEDARDPLPALVEEARRGEEIVLTNGGRPVAQITPAPANLAKPSNDEIRAFLAELDEGWPIGKRDWTRADLYELRHRASMGCNSGTHCYGPPPGVPAAPCC